MDYGPSTPYLAWRFDAQILRQVGLDHDALIEALARHTTGSLDVDGLSPASAPPPVPVDRSRLRLAALASRTAAGGRGDEAEPSPACDPECLEAHCAAYARARRNDLDALRARVSEAI